MAPDATGPCEQSRLGADLNQFSLSVVTGVAARGVTRVTDNDAVLSINPWGCVFQRHVASVADLRVTIIGDEMFAAAVDLRDLEYDVDVRMNLNAKHVAHDLPDDIADKLRV
jgi:hypothetical protein